MKRKILSVSLLICIGTALLFQPADSNAQLKSSPRAFFSSLLLPGLGQHYIGHKSSIKYFAGAELLMIGLGFGHDEYSKWLEEDYRAFASERAGVEVVGKSKQFLIEMSKFNSIFLYNEQMRRDRMFELVIPETPDNIWVWDSFDDRVAFHYKRVDADTYSNRAVFYYTGVFLNHLISGIHAAILAKQYNGKQVATGKGTWGVRAIPTPLNSKNPGLKLKVSYSF